MSRLATKRILLGAALLLTTTHSMADKYGLDEIADGLPMGENLSGFVPVLGALLLAAVLVRLLMIWLRIPGSGGFLGSLGKFILLLCTAYFCLAAFFGCIAAVMWLARLIGFDVPWLSFAAGFVLAWKASLWIIDRANRPASTQPCEAREDDPAPGESAERSVREPDSDSPHQARPTLVASSAPSQQTLSRPSERLSAAEIEALLEDAKQGSRRMKELREAEALRKP